MFSNKFRKYLSEKTGIDELILDELYYDSSDIFNIAMNLIEKYNIDRTELGRLWGDFLGYAYVDPNTTIINMDLVKKLGKEFIVKNKVIPLYKFGKAVTVCTSEPDNIYMQDVIEKKLGEIVSLVFCFPFDVDWVLFKLKNL